MESSVLPIDQTIILKHPLTDNDSFIFEMKNVKCDLLKFEDIFGAFGDDYAHEKVRMFKTMDTSTKSLMKFKTSIPSCRNIDSYMTLDKTNYRVALRDIHKNVYKYVNDLREKKSRRCILTFADPIQDYYASECERQYIKKDISCLSQIMIHDNNVTITYRASDMTHDFLVDFFTIIKFILNRDLFMDKFNLLWISNTCQFRDSAETNMARVFKLFRRISDKYIVK